MKLRDFITNGETGKTPRQCEAELREVAGETRHRQVNHNTTEDQQWRAKNLRDARGQVN
jgi:hypothetical protein